MTPRREKFIEELKYFQKVFIRRLSRVELSLLKLNHREKELRRILYELTEKISASNDDNIEENGNPVRLSEVYKAVNRD